MCSLFIYKVTDTLTDSTKDISLEWKLPVDEFLQFNIGMLSVPFWHVFAVCDFGALFKKCLLCIQFHN